MLRNLLYSFFLHFVVLVLVYFSSRDLYYYNLRILNEEAKNPIKIKLTSAYELKKMQGVAKETKAKKEAEKEKNIKHKDIEQIKKLSSAVNATMISESFMKKETIPDAINNFKYIEKPETRPEDEIKGETEEVKPETIKLGETEKKPVEEQKTAENEEKESQTKINANENTTDDESLPNETNIREDGANVIELSLREKINIQRQIKSCYKMAIVRSGNDSKTKVIINISLNRDGNVDMSKITNEDQDKYSKLSEKEKMDFDTAVTNAKNALIFCSPLRNLPANKYKVWHEMSLEFDSQNIEIDKEVSEVNNVGNKVD